MDIRIEIDARDAITRLNRTSRQIDTALRGAIEEGQSLLMRALTTYPPPPSPIQGPANVPVRTFTTRNGQTVRLRANKVSGKGITMQKASSLRYVRTNVLKGSWHAPAPTEASGALVGRVVSSGQAAPYNIYVQDATRQARIHQGRWTNTAQAVAESSNDAIQDMFRARIEAVVGGG